MRWGLPCEGEAAADAVLREGGGARVRPGGREAGRAFPIRAVAREPIDRAHAPTPSWPPRRPRRRRTRRGRRACIPRRDPVKRTGRSREARPRSRARAMASSLSEPAGVEASSAVEARTVPRVTTREARPRRDAPAGGERESGFAARENMVEVAIATPRVEVRRCPRNRREGASEQGRITEVPNGRPASAISAAVKICERRDDPTLMRIITGAINSRRTGKKNHAFEKQNASPS